jgi:hypothetical protein
MVEALAQFGGLIGPAINHSAQLLRREQGKRFAVIGREADHPAHPCRRLGAKQGIIAACLAGIIGQRGEIIIEHVDAGVIRIARAPDTGIAGTQVAGGIMGGRRRLRRSDFALPRTPHALRGDLHPATRQRIMTPVRPRAIDRHQAALSCGPANAVRGAKTARPPSTKRFTASAAVTLVTSVITMKWM